MTTTITSSTFASDVLNSPKPVLIDFWAPWCGPCRMVAPVIEKIAADFAATHVVAKVNVDEEPDLASQFGVSSIPALLLFKGGQVAGRMVGFQSEAKLAQFLKANS